MKFKLMVWCYIICGVEYLLFIGPDLISAADTSLVLLGIAWYVLYAVWSWVLWIKPLLKYLKEGFDEINR